MTTTGKKIKGLGRRLACPSVGADVVAGGRLGVVDAQSGREVGARWVDVGSVHGWVQHLPGDGALGHCVAEVYRHVVSSLPEMKWRGSVRNEIAINAPKE